MADTLLSHHVGRGRRGLVRLQWSCILATSGRGSVGPSGRSPIPSCRRPSISSSWQRLARRAVHHSEHKERKGNITPNCFAVAQKNSPLVITIGHRLPDLRCALFRVPSSRTLPLALFRCCRGSPEPDEVNTHVRVSVSLQICKTGFAQSAIATSFTAMTKEPTRA